MIANSAGRAALAVAVLVMVWAMAIPAAAECNDRWQTAQKLTDNAKALQKNNEYVQAAQAFENAALAWQRAAGDCLRAQADAAKQNYDACLKNAQLMICLKNFDTAQAIANQALKLSGQGKWKEAEEAYMKAQEAWLIVAKGCDPDNAQSAQRNAKEAAKNALTASDNYLAEKRRGN